MCLSEFHTSKIISLPGFHLKKQKFRRKKHKGPKIAGGIAVFINQKIVSNFRIIQNDHEDSIWIKSIGDDKTLFGFYYCSPDYGDSNFFEIVNGEINKLNNKENTLIFGDFNARTKTECENVVHDKYDEDLGIHSEPICRSPATPKTLN